MALTQVSTDGVKDGSLLNADINASAAISKSKIENLINNNADNRVITGSGTANTLNGESSVVIDSIGQVSVGGSTTAFDTTGSLNGLQGYYETDSGIATIGSYSSGGSTVLNFHTNSGGAASAERMRIDSSGKVGIGTGTIRLAEQLHVLGNGIVTSSAENTNMGLFGTFGGSDLLVGTFNANNVVVRRGNTNVARFTQNGFIPNGTDTAAANALDDYEEGTYTPSVDAWSGYTSVFGYYVKIGKLVNAWGGVEDPSSTTSGSAVQISLPYTATANNHGLGGAGGVMTENVNLSSGNETVVYVKPNDSKFRIYHTTNSYWSTVNGDDCNSASYIYFHVTYYIS